MDRRQQTRALGLAVIGIAVLGLLSLTAAGARELPGTTRSLAVSWTIDVIQVIQVGVGLLIIGAILWSLVNGRRGEKEEQPRKKTLPKRQSALAVLLVLSALAVLVFLIPRRAGDIFEDAPPTLNLSEVDFPRIEDVGAGWPLLVLVVAAAITIFVLTMLARQPDDGLEDLDTGAVVADTLTNALDDLHWADDPRSVIIRAYHEIEAALADAGMPRVVSEAPREYLQRVLGSAGMRPDSITRLTTLFELARFSEQELGEADRVEAEAALRSALDDLGVAAR